MAEYVSDVIKEEYKEWKPGHMIFLSAHTGAGKTYFVLYELVEFAAIEGKRILYLVNRSILKEQIEEKINTEIRSKLRSNNEITSENLANVIEVRLYQTIENVCRDNADYNTQEDYDYIIADECHYFLEDSMFNTYTQLSYEWIMGRQYSATLIFISATIDRIKDYILRDNNISDAEGRENTGHGLRVMRGDVEIHDRVRNYGINADYAYVKVSLLKKIEEISELVEKDKSKWLIFVDSIGTGETIDKSLREKKIDSVFITAETKKDRELSGIIQKVRIREKYEQRVLIATSVMDNGISLKDYELRKLIIMAVTKEQFIQMLGRKRMTLKTEKLEVYLLMREKEYFRKLCSECEERQRFISEAEKEDYLVNTSWMLGKILESKVFYQCAKNFCYVSQGMAAFSKLAIAQCDYLYEYYCRMVEKFEKEEGTAFLREQFKWLERKEAEEEIKELTKTVLDNICEIIEKYKGKELKKEESEELRDKVRWDIRQLLECRTYDKECLESKRKNMIEDLKKSSKDKPFSEKKFNMAMELLNLNYRMTKPNRGTFLISDKNLEQRSEQEKETANSSSEE